MEPLYGAALDTPWATWPTYQRTGRQQIFNWSELEHHREAATAEPVDLDNSGTLSRAVVAESWAGGPNGDQSVWSRLPANSTDSDVTALQNRLYGIDETKAQQLRSSGTIVFAGDQTAFGEIWPVHLFPFRNGSTTYLLATAQHWPKTDIVLRPDPSGDLTEVCAFREEPPL